jgi:hypothetical protein
MDCAAVCGSVRQCAVMRVAVCVCGSAHGGVHAVCAAVCAAVWLVVYGGACAAAVRAAVCGSVCGSVCGNSVWRNKYDFISISMLLHECIGIEINENEFKWICMRYYYVNLDWLKWCNSKLLEFVWICCAFVVNLLWIYVNLNEFRWIYDNDIAAVGDRVFSQLPSAEISTVDPPLGFPSLWINMHEYESIFLFLF